MRGTRNAAGALVLGSLDFIPWPGRQGGQGWRPFHRLHGPARRGDGWRGSAVNRSSWGSPRRPRSDDALRSGGSVTLHAALAGSRQIVGLNELGEFVDHTGETIKPGQIAEFMLQHPQGGNVRFEVNIPHGAGSEAAAPEAAALTGKPPERGAGAVASELPPEAPSEGGFLGGGRTSLLPSLPCRGRPLSRPYRPASAIIWTCRPCRAGTLSTCRASNRGLGFTGRMDEPRSAEEMAALARTRRS
jgi:hypothetical protein